ncbi:mechanosensitive ion channel domain-containing protein [Salinibaculum salinum]|uniref:mechanosensitive ion channel domain-containing protein n=1 Tax=Salinibaculum salinum TaxID=3131996 RepID=UPI0030EF0029
MQIEWARYIRRIFSEETAFTISVAILVLGILIAYWVWRWTHTVMRQIGVDDLVEGTPFERTAQNFGTSTISILAQLAALFVYIASIILALNIAQLTDVQLFWAQITGYLPRLFIAILALIVGLVAGDKAKLVVSDHLRSIKLPEAEIIPEIVKYSIFYIAFLLALSQVGVATEALLVLLAAYSFGLVFLSGLAFKDLLAASAAGIYLLLVEPYAIGDKVEIDDKRGIVQEVDMFVTHIETDGEEYIIPNQRVIRSGIIRIRE